jgi:copper chaperone CopZ
MKVLKYIVSAIPQSWIHKRTIQFLLLLIAILFNFQAVNAQANNDFTFSTFKVFGECGQCKARIEKSLKIKGIQSANWVVNTEMLSVSYDSSKINFDEIQSKVVAAGHDTEFKKAKDETYNALPECCLYRDTKETDDSSHANSDAFNHDNSISGIVVSQDNKGNFMPLAGASIFWSGTQEGTVSDKHGVFIISKNEAQSKLIVSYTGFQADSIVITSAHQLQVVLAANGTLSVIKIKGKARPTYINDLGPFRSLMINSKDLLL